jgi:hypothetical protein
MKKPILFNITIALMVSAAGAAHAQNLVQNSNFAAGPANWSSSNVGFGQIGDSLNAPDFGSPVAYSNSQAYWFDGAHAILDQTIATVMGQAYSYSLSVYAPIDGASAGLFEMVGGTTVLSLQSPNLPYGGWTNYTGSFTADGNNDDLHIEFGSDSDYYWNIGVTNVVVQSVPEPSSMLALGLPALGLLLRRKKK